MNFSTWIYQKERQLRFRKRRGAHTTQHNQLNDSSREIFMSLQTYHVLNIIIYRVFGRENAISRHQKMYILDHFRLIILLRELTLFCLQLSTIAISIYWNRRIFFICIFIWLRFLKLQQQDIYFQRFFSLCSPLRRRNKFSTKHRTFNSAQFSNHFPLFGFILVGFLFLSNDKTNSRQTIILDNKSVLQFYCIRTQTFRLGSDDDDDDDDDDDYYEW